MAFYSQGAERFKPRKRTFYWAKYLRKSTEEDLSRSIRNQDVVLDGVMERMIAQDTENEYLFYATFQDEDYTGTDSDRPQFKRLLRALASGKVNMLLVTDLSRLSRNISESMQYVQGLFVALDIRFISVQLPALDSFLEPEKIYSLEVPMQSMLNERHCAETSFKVRRTFNRLREQGKFIGAFPAYGWKKDPMDHHKLLLDQEAAQILHRMKDWILEGYTPPEVAKMLNLRGIPNPTAYKANHGLKFSPGCRQPSTLWTSRTVRYLMTRPENTGTLIQGRYRIKSYKIHQQIKTPPEEWFVSEHGIPAIFSNEEQELIAAILNRSTRVSPTSQGKNVSLFSGFLKCPDCGKAIVQKKVKKYIYYICSSYKNYGSDCCTSHRIRHEALESAVLAAIQLQLSLFVEKNEALRLLRQTPSDEARIQSYESLYKAHLKEQEEIRCFKRYLYEDWKKGNLTQEEYQSLKKHYTTRETQLKQMLLTLQKEQAESHALHPESDPLIAAFIKTGTITNLTREILTALVDKIFIHEHGFVTIRFCFADEYQKEIDHSLENSQKQKQI